MSIDKWSGTERQTSIRTLITDKYIVIPNLSLISDYDHKVRLLLLLLVNVKHSKSANERKNMDLCIEVLWFSSHRWEFCDQYV